MRLITPKSQGGAQATAPPLFTPAEPGTGDARPHWRGGLEFGAASRRGPHHPENEDSYLLSAGAGLPIGVADGVGGGALGKVASRVMTQRMRLLTSALLSDTAQLRAWLLASDDAIAAEIARGAERAGASTFVAAAPSSGGRHWAFTWAGDCRAYLLTAANQLQCLTIDDTYKNLRETPPQGGSPDDPARMVGNGAVDQANLGQVHLAEGDILFLCSDGVHRFVPGAQIVSILRAGGSLEQCCNRLTAAAHLNGGHDDATVVAVQRHGWFGVRHAPRWLGLLALVVLVAALAWQYFLREGHTAPAPAPPPVATPVPSGRPAPDSPLSPAPAAESLRLTPDHALNSGLRPLDVAAPVKKPPSAGKRERENARHPRIPQSSGASDAAAGAPTTDTPGTGRTPESTPGNGEKP